MWSRKTAPTARRLGAAPSARTLREREGEAGEADLFFVTTTHVCILRPTAQTSNVFARACPGPAGPTFLAVRRAVSHRMAMPMGCVDLKIITRVRLTEAPP